jgi:hypothetical protein
VPVGLGKGNVSTNVAVGSSALNANTAGDNNTAIGTLSLLANTTGIWNTACGSGALYSNASGNRNTSVGIGSLQNSTTGSDNVALGKYAGLSAVSGNNVICNNSVFIGVDTKVNATSETNQIVIGHSAVGLGSNTAVLGNASITTTALRGNVGIGTTAPSSKLHVAETWNASGTTFAAAKIVVTDTASAVGSDFLELYSGSATQPLKLDIQKTGQMNIYGAWTDASNYERLSFSAPTAANAVIGTNKAGTGTARGLEFQTDGVKRIEIQPGGNTIISNTVTVSGNVNVGYLLRLATLTVSTLPNATASPFPTLVGVTDSTVTAAAGKGNTVAGGGSNKVIVMSDGTNWVIL